MPNTGTLAGLTASTEYVLDAVHLDDWGNVSDVVSSAAFTTDVSPAVTSLSAIAGFDYELTDVSGHTFGGLMFGPAAANRVIFAFFFREASGGTALSAVTIGGQTATLIESQVLNTSRTLEVWKAGVPTGLSGDVVVTGAGRAYGVALFQTYGKTDGARAGSGGFQSAADVSLTLSGGEDIIAVAVTSNGVPIGWAGLTEQTEIDVRSDEWFSAALELNVAAASPRTITANQDPADQIAAIAVALS